ncbi:MAG TPA: hypothetical protein VD788_03230, partial [Candidatus Polarisedimenticolaceae bacterium]|nr:hypothetical protein [Candidatus Polarisedimenticolaceae bacterium]
VAGRLGTARRAEEAWVLERIDRGGGPRSLDCGLAPLYSDDDAQIVEPDPETRARYLPGHSATTAGSIDFLP